MELFGSELSLEQMIGLVEGNAARATGLNAGHITECCRGRYGRKTCGGYVWRYESNEVEPFPIAVTRYHFKEVHNGK